VVTRGDRGRAGEPVAACAADAALGQGPEGAPPAMPGGMEGAGSRGDARAEESQEYRAGLAAAYARIEQYGPWRAFIREAEAWLAQCCQRTRQDCLPGHVTAFMEAVFVPGHQDARSASGAPCCAPRTVERALSRLMVWFKGAGRTKPWALLAESSVQCCNPVVSQEVMVWQMAHEHSVVTGTDVFMPPAAPTTAAAGAAAGAGGRRSGAQQGGGAAAAGPGQGGSAGPGLGGAAGQGQGGAAAAGSAQGAAAGRRQRHLAAAALGFTQGAAAAAARPARRAAVRPGEGGAGDAVTDAEYMQSLAEMEAELGGRGRPAEAAVPPPQQAEAGQARPAPEPMRPAQPPPRARRRGQAAAAAGASRVRAAGDGGARPALRAWPPASPGTARRARVPRLHAC